MRDTLPKICSTQVDSWWKKPEHCAVNMAQTYALIVEQEEELLLLACVGRDTTAAEKLLDHLRESLAAMKR